MIITNLKGGLGNQMFQYATGLAISIKNNTEMKIDVTGYSSASVLNSDTVRTFDLKYFNISKTIAEADEIKKLKYPLGIVSKAWRFFKAKVLKQHYQDYHPEILKKKDYYLDGFWQSEKNFLEIRELILKEFTFKQESENYKKVISSESSRPTSNSLSVHIRHGDYLNDKKTKAVHGVLDIQYYKDAFDIVKEKVDQVLIFTDDPEWVKENFGFITKTTIYVSDLNLRDEEELILMSKCSHNIIANSSFSWWGAWLNQNDDKIVISPTPWVDKIPNPHLNITPESWIKIPKK